MKTAPRIVAPCDTSFQIKRSVAAFTLMELLTVVAVVGILASLIIPAISSVRKSAQSTTCLSNLRQIISSAISYAADNNSYLPPRNDGSHDVNYWPIWLLEGTNKTPAINKALICPTIYQMGSQYYLTKKTLLGNDRPFTYGVNSELAGRYNGADSYLGFGKKRWKLIELRDLSKTALYAEARTGGGFIVEYRDKTEGERLLYPHGGANNFAFADGHVESLKKEQIPTDKDDVFWTGHVTGK